MRRFLTGPIRILSAFLATFWVLSGVAAAEAEERTRPLDIVVTTGMIADAVERIGGERVKVTSLMGTGVDPHTYRQTRSDVAAMMGADAVFWHGLFLEAQLKSFLENLAARKPVIAVAEALPEDVLVASTEYRGQPDPHVWMDPDLWSEVVNVVRNALVALDPDGSRHFDANARRYRDEIEALANYARTVLATVPEASRILVTAHDAFGYFGRAYGFEVEGIQGISTDSEAGLRRIEELVNLIVEREIGAVFVESSVPDRNVLALVEGAAARGHKVVIGGELFSDAMGPPKTWEGTYVGMIDHNVTLIARALGGDAPEAGMNGRLSTIN